MRYIFIIAILFLGAKSVVAQDLDQNWDKANTEYSNGNFAGAIAIYDSILTTGHSSYKLYYNLANAHYRQEHIGQAILNYQRALVLAPNDADVKHNLSIAGRYVKDKTQSVPEFFVVTWLGSLQRSVSSNGWAIVSLVVLLVTLSLVLMYLLSGQFLIRKIGFWGAVFGIMLFIFSVVFAVNNKNEITNPTQAVVMTSTASVKSSPGDVGKDIFVLHEGTVVTVHTTLGEWREISIADGNKGWVVASSIEMI